jgi:hypothetical protein
VHVAWTSASGIYDLFVFWSPDDASRDLAIRRHVARKIPIKEVLSRKAVQQVDHQTAISIPLFKEPLVFECFSADIVNWSQVHSQVMVNSASQISDVKRSASACGFRPHNNGLSNSGLLYL